MDSAAWRRVLRWCAVVLVVFLAVQAVRCLTAGGPALPDYLAGADAQSAVQREGVPDATEYEAIVEEEHFGKKPKPPQPQLFGILGDRALIGPSANNAELKKVGDTLPGDHLLVEVGADYVVVEREGERRTLKLFGDTICPPAEEPRPEAGPEPGGGRPGPEGPPKPQAGPDEREDAEEGGDRPAGTPAEIRLREEEKEQIRIMLEGAIRDARSH
jgi:hypothetical protein